MPRYEVTVRVDATFTIYVTADDEDSACRAAGMLARVSPEVLTNADVEVQACAAVAA